MSELNIASTKALQTAINVYERINDMFKAFGIVAGGVFASLADWVFGAVTMGVLLSNYSEFSDPWVKWTVGGIFSGALWGVQLILWQTVLSGKLRELIKKRSPELTIYIAAVIGVILMKFGDDFSDIAGVLWLIRDNPMNGVLTAKIYNALQYTILFLVWAICGFAEVFVALSLNLLKSGQGGGGRPGGQPQGNNQRPHQGQGHHQGKPGGFAQRAELERARAVGGQGDRPTPAAASRPLYNEPTYHPITQPRESNREY